VAASSAMIIADFLVEGKGGKLSFVRGIEGRYRYGGSEKAVRGSWEAGCRDVGVKVRVGVRLKSCKASGIRHVTR